MLHLKIISTFAFIMNNTRFATVIHILTLLEESPGEWLSSDSIAGSINIHPVIVRKELGHLQEQGFVVSRKGKVGGSTLGMPSDKILLSDIYQMLKNSEVLGKKNMHTNLKCPVGKNINKQLDLLYSEIDETVLTALSNRTLKDFVQKFH